MKTPSFNGKTKPTTFWRIHSKADPRAWEYFLGVGNAILDHITIFDIPDNSLIKSGYWTKSTCGRRGCGCLVPKWVTVKTYKAKTLKRRTRRIAFLSYE